MQKLASVLFALSVLGSTALASAQMQPPPMQPPPAPHTPPAQPSPATPPAGQPNFGQLISSLNNMQAEIAKVQSMNNTSANSVRPVDVAQLKGDPAALNSALAKNQGKVTTLRDTLGKVNVTTNSNEHITLAQFLADNKINVSQVVGADVNDGTLVLFYQKP